MLPHGSTYLLDYSKPETNWESLWKEYIIALENWKQMYESVQKASLEMQQRFNEVIEKAVKESSFETLQQFGENWQKK